MAITDNLQPDRRRNPDGNQNYVITRLWEHHNEIVRLLVAGVSSNVEIARLVGCTPQTVSNVRNNPVVQARIAELSAQRDSEAVDIGKRIQEVLPLAVDMARKAIVEGIDSDTLTESHNAVMVSGLRAASMLLDQIPKKTTSENLHTHISLGRINEIKKTVDDAKMQKAVAAEIVQ